MVTNTPIPLDRLNLQRQAIGMTFPVLAKRSGVSVPTLKRLLGGHAAAASFATVSAVAGALGFSITLDETDADAVCRAQARRKAEEIARLVQGTSALESQAVDADTYRRLVERSYHELLAGPKRRLWSA